MTDFSVHTGVTLSDDASIVEAFNKYHTGSITGSPVSANSIAKYLTDLETAIGAIPLTSFIKKAPSDAAENLIQPTNAAYIPLTIKGAVGQTEKLLSLTDSADAVKVAAYVDGMITSNYISINNATKPTTTALYVGPSNAAHIGAVIKGTSSQTANLQEWQNSSGTALAKISSGGKIYSYSTTDSAAIEVATLSDTQTLTNKTVVLKQDAKTNNYIYAKTDTSKLIVMNKSTSVTLTMPPDSDVGTWEADSQVQFLNIGAGTLTIVAGSGVTINGSQLTFATSKGGMLIRTAANVWTLVPLSGGSEWADFSDTPTGTYTDADGTWKYKRYTLNGSLTVTRAGLMDILVIGAGGPGQAAYANGIGGRTIYGLHKLTAATHTITIGNPAGFPSAGGTTVLGPLSTGTSGGAAGAISSQITSAITGTSLDYAKSAQSSPRANYGDGGIESGSTLGSTGVVIVRVPA